MADYPRPLNGWGQGAKNATNGWGGAAGNATNGFGYIHPFSPPHPATDLVGGGAFPTDGLLYSQLTNTPFSINSGAGLNFVIANGDNITYADLSGVTVVSQIGTANIHVVGNELQAQANGDLFGYELSNGVICNLISNNTEYAYDSANIAHGTINGATLLPSRSEGQQLYNWGWNAYAYFMDSKYITLPITTISAVGEYAEIDYLTNILGASLGGQGSGNRVEISSGRVKVFYTRNGVLTSTTLAFVDFLGVRTKVKVLAIAGGNLEFYINDTLTFTSTGGNDSFTVERIGSYYTVYMDGIVFNLDLNGVNHNTANSFNGGVESTPFTYTHITGATADATIDTYGEAILRPYLTNYYNAPLTNTHFAQLEATAGSVILTGADFSIIQMLKVPTGVTALETVFDNGKAQLKLSSTLLSFSRDGGVTTTTYAVVAAEVLYIAITSTAAGVTDIYVGDIATEPLLVVDDGAAGAGAVATSAMISNNIVAKNNGIENYHQDSGYYNVILTPSQILEAYNFLKGDFILFATFVNIFDNKFL